MMPSFGTHEAPTRTFFRAPRTSSGMNVALFRANAKKGVVIPKKSTPTGLTSVIFQLPRWKLEAIREMAKATRVRQSEYFREAVADLLAKHDLT